MIKIKGGFVIDNGKMDIKGKYVGDIPMEEGEYPIDGGTHFRKIKGVVRVYKKDEIGDIIKGVRLIPESVEIMKILGVRGNEFYKDCDIKFK